MIWKGNMKMYSFKNDYSELAHQDVMDLMIKTLSEQNNGYGLDVHTEKAKMLIKKYLTPNVDIHLLVGGTSANKIVISHLLKPYQAVISVATGHINVHETGAIEACGHKVLTVKGADGKITPQEIAEVCRVHSDEHMVMPKMVYLSDSTEIGTIYTKKELAAISKACKDLGLYLYLDGARLGVALTAKENDLTLDDIARLTDTFYIGGTKNGALIGEAVVIVNPDLKDDFRFSIKQNGGLLAKGFLTGIQFEALFTDNLFFRLAQHANDAARILKEGLKAINVKFASDSPTNQQFIILDNDIIAELEKHYLFEIWEKQQNRSSIRLVTSWATDMNEIPRFIAFVKGLLTNKK
jgi:threonine aldolase